MVDMPLLHHDSVMSVSMSYRLVQEFSCLVTTATIALPARVTDVTASRFQFVLIAHF